MSPDHLSPAERMERFKREMTLEEAGLTQYWTTLSFAPDKFQVEALEAVALGNSVLVSAPTGAGKTVVGEGAAYLALEKGERIFYTTPIKALSNQKFRDFQHRFGKDQVGLLTGDSAVNPDAPLVVMTTEVLRNMIYAGTDLSALGVVVLDEVHYLADRFRGPVWEEVMIQLPDWVQVVALSATVSNVQEFGGWIESIRGSCDEVVTHERPVPLYQHMLVGRSLYDLYSTPRRRGPARINPELIEATSRPDPRDEGGRLGRQRFRRPRTAPREAQVEILERARLLPAIVFVFSRAGCDDAADQVASARLGLTTTEERQQIRKAVDSALATIPAGDQAALGLHRWAANLEEGVAAHHAGLLPIMKETIEKLFSEGLIKVVYATETLALGINMPAKSVLLESLEKWNGSEHVRLAPTEYTQLTGRAGRRGIDVEGHAIVLDRGMVAPQEVATLASGRSYPLKSAFQPNYNMAVNLLARTDMKHARQVLESSFAQYQADASIVVLAQKLRRTNEELAQAKGGLDCEYGDAAEYFALREQVSGLQKEAARQAKSERSEEDVRLLRRLRKGDVITYQRGRRRRRAVVVQGPDSALHTPLARVVAEDGKPATIGPREAGEGLTTIGRIFVPKGGARRPRDRAALAAEVRSIPTKTKTGSKGGRRGSRSPDSPSAALLREADALERQLSAHPVHACPERERHAPAGHNYARLRKKQRRLAQQINDRTSHVVEDFDKVCNVLRGLDFLAEDAVTRRGQELRRIFGERDLVAALAIAQGAWDNLKPEELAAIVSTVVHVPRGDEASGDHQVFLPTGNLQGAWNQTMQAYDSVHRQEVKVGREVTVEPSAALADVTYRWAKDAPLADLLDESGLSGGDFVRGIRQTIDMLEQMRRLKNPQLAKTASEARRRLLHGVVAWTEVG